MHLDTVMTMVDRDAFLMYPGVVEDAADLVDHARRRAGRARGRAPSPKLFDAIADALDLDDAPHLHDRRRRDGGRS